MSAVVTDDGQEVKLDERRRAFRKSIYILSFLYIGITCVFLSLTVEIKVIGRSVCIHCALGKSIKRIEIANAGELFSWPSIEETGLYKRLGSRVPGHAHSFAPISFEFGQAPYLGPRVLDQLPQAALGSVSVEQIEKISLIWPSFIDRVRDDILLPRRDKKHLVVWYSHLLWDMARDGSDENITRRSQDWVEKSIRIPKKNSDVPTKEWLKERGLGPGDKET